MFNKLFNYKRLLCLAFCFALFSVGHATELALDEAVEMLKPYPLSAAEYLSQAERQQGNSQQTLLLMAAGRLITEHQWQAGLTILTQTSHLTAQQEDEKNILLAQVALLRGQTEAALKSLQSVHKSQSLSLYQQTQYHELLAQAYHLTGKGAQALAERIKLESLLTDEQEKNNNRQALWLTLINMPFNEVGLMKEEAAPSSELQGWLQLAELSQRHNNDPNTLLAALDHWQSQFDLHPANFILPNPLDSIAGKMLTNPKKIALLLPLSGPFAGPGNAVREGFMAAHTTNKEAAVQISLYDTNKADATRLYEQAVNEGAEYIVGPLLKNQVTAVAALPHPVPTLLLNEAHYSQDNSYSFSLSPANEAMQVALKAHSKGLTRALVIAPNNEWGDDIVRSFSTHWKQNGGAIADVFYYNVSPTIKEDFNKKISDFLQITDSQKRIKQVQELLGYSVQTAPSRRQDFDMIFLLAYPSKARQIIPALRYYYADDVPVYATSTVYSGHANVLKDRDLEGVIFCDIPWVFTHQMDVKNWPEQFNSYNRLYALGSDSYALATQLNQLILFSAYGAKKSNGTLYLKPNQQVARVLEWGQFKQGVAHSIS